VAQSGHISDAAKRVTDFAVGVRKQATSSEEVIDRISAVIHKIDAQSRDSSDKAVLLTKFAEEITSISKSIAHIAQNVTVVAINASIEAARAGAAGKTFQVVAQQVQGLAQQTTEAAEEISGLADRIKGNVSQITRNMVENRSVVQTGVQISEEAIEKQQTIVQAIDDMQQLLRGVVKNAEEQRENSLKIAQGIQVLRQKTEQNLQLIELTAASTEETAAIMEDNASVVKRLRERSDALRQMIADIK